MCRQAEQSGRCVCVWGAAVGDVDRQPTVVRPAADAGHLPCHRPAQVPGVPLKHANSAEGAGSGLHVQGA